MCVCAVKGVVDCFVTEGFGACLLSTKEVDADVLGDAVKPRVKCTLASEGVEGVIGFDKYVLCEVLGCLSVVYLPVNEGLDAGLVFENKGVECLSVPLLCAVNEGVFVKMEQYSVPVFRP